MGRHSLRRDLRAGAPRSRFAAGSNGARNATDRMAVALRLLRPREERRALKKILIPAAALLAAGAAWLYLRKPEIPSVVFAKVMRESLVSTLPTNGKVEPLVWEAVRSEA